MDAPPPRSAPRPTPRRRLAVRLAWLTAAMIVSTELLFFVPSVVRLRQDWLDRRLTEAHLAALSAAVAPEGMIDRATRDEILRLAGAEAITLEQAGHVRTILDSAGAAPDAAILDLRHETPFAAMLRTAVATFADSDRLIRLQGVSPMREDSVVTVVLRESHLHTALMRYARRIGTITLLVAAAAGTLLYLALLFLLVRPMHRLTASIAAFRADPERSAPLDEAVIGTAREDEIAAAARELASMQQELRAALWRNARLAALGTAVAKINHDLRGILSPAMLTAERLQMHADPAVQRAGDVLVRGVERATELVRRTLDFARETPSTLARRPLALRPVVEEAAEQCRAACPWVVVVNHVPADIVVDADRESLGRVFGNLMRNAGEAEARHITVTATPEDRELVIVVVDDGPGLPASVRAGLFRPFVTGGRRGSTGLGLAIVHDLMSAHGGDAVLLDSGAGGTRFRLTLPYRPAAPAAAPIAASQATAETD